MILKTAYGIRGLFILIAGVLFAGAVSSAELSQTIEAVKPSVVGIGSFLITRSPAITFVGTGFVVEDGLNVITNAHVIQGIIASENKETLGILVSKGENVDFRRASVVAIDTEHDLARLKITGTPLRAMELGNSASVIEGQSLAFTGFPLGMVLGLHHVTHRGMVAAITPVVMPALDARKLDVKVVAQLRKSPYLVFQLDATAFPGNSGSPLYDPATGTVFGVINSVFVKGTKEAAITNPSGITYAIPAKYVTDLLQAKQP